MQCRACGTDNPPQANYCVECGDPLTNVSRLAGAADPTPVPASDDLAGERVLLEMMRRQRERDRRLMRLTLGIAMTALVLAVVAGAGAWWPRLTRQAAGPAATRSMAEDAPSGSTLTTSERPAATAPASGRRAEPRAAAPAVTVREEQPVPPMPPAEPPASGGEAAVSEAPARQAPARADTPREPNGRRSAGVNVRDRAGRSAGDNGAAASRRTPNAELPPATARREPAREAPAALPNPAGALNDVDVRVRPRGNDGGGEIREYVVTLKDAQGAPYTNADVALRGETSGGDIVEVTLEPGAPGVYAAAVRVRPDGPRNLKVRITRDGATSVIAVPQSGS